MKREKKMNGTLEQLAKGKVPWLRIFLGDDARNEGKDVDRRLDRQDRTEQDWAEVEMFWAGRTPAMRRSARVAA